jgi:hypothetical protein
MWRGVSRADADLDFSGDVFAQFACSVSHQLEIFCRSFRPDLR